MLPRLLFSACLMLVALAAMGAFAAPALIEGFEGPDASWIQPAQRGATRVVQQRRERTERGDQPIGAERVRFVCPAGYSGVFLQPIGRAPVIEEFRAAVVYKGSSQGAQLAVQLVFPRSASSPGGESLRAIVRGGDRYESPGQWATLSLDKLPVLVKRQARLLRSQHPQLEIDERGAYVDAVALIVPGGPRGAEFWTDELTVEGVLADALIGSDRGGSQKPEGSRSGSVPNEAPPITVSSRGFSRGGRSLLPRIWSYDGESFRTIRQLGFNAVALENYPSEKLAKDLSTNHLLALCAPPSIDEVAGLDDQALAAVMGWRVQGSTDIELLDSARPEVDRLRNDRLLAKRPLVAEPTAGVAAWSRLADVVSLQAGAGRLRGDRFGSSYAEARPGAPALARVRLTHSPQAISQLRAFAPAGKAVAWRSPGAIEADVWSAVAAGAKGVWLESSQALGGASKQEERLAAAVELLNLKLSLAEPWISTGERVGAVLDRQRRPVAVILRRGRTKLVLGYRALEADRKVLVVPAVSETAMAYTMTPAGLASLERRRALGGVTVPAEVLAPGSFVLMTDDRAAVREIEKRIAQTARRAVALQQALTEADMVEWRELATGSSNPSRSSSPVAESAQRWISQSKSAGARGEWALAYRTCAIARSLMSGARDEYRRRLRPTDRIESSPLAEHPSTWPDELRLRKLLGALPRGGNLLEGGDFEDLESVRKVGWRHTQLEGSAGRATVELSTEAPVHGARRLTIRIADGGDKNPAPVWVTSPKAPLRAGQLVELSGWVRLDKEAGEDGRLSIVDSLGGEELALTLEESGGWESFRVLRRAPEAGELKVSFVMSGVGSASLDAVMVREIVLTAPDSQRQADARTETAYEK